MLALLTWCAAGALAAEVPDPGPVVEATEIAERDPELGRELLTWMASSEALAEARRAEAAAALATLPPRPSDDMTTVKLVGWQTLAGAWALGPGIALSTPGWVHPTVTTTGMLAGGAVGAGTALWYARGGRLTTARATAIIGAQQLGVFNGVSTALVIDDAAFDPALGATVGVGIGAVGGYLLAGLPLDDGAIATAHSAALWGAGLGYAFGVAFTDPDGSQWRTEWIALLVGSDLGAVGGYALGRGLGIERDQLRMVNVGVIGGVALGALVLAAVQPDGDGAGQVIGMTLGMGGVLGAAGGVTLVRAVDRPGKGRVALRGPLPVLAPTAAGGGARLSLVRGTW